MAQCSACSKSVNPAAKFCGNCGAPQAVVPTADVQAKRMGHSDDFLSRQSAKPSRFLASSSTRNSISQDSQSAISRTVFIVPEGFMNEFQALLSLNNLTPIDLICPSPSEDLSKILREVAEKSADSDLTYVVIVGDWETIAPARIPNPLSEDGDLFCLTDSPHLFNEDSEDEQWIQPAMTHIQVGRIPVADIKIVRNLFSHSETFARNTDPVSLAVSAECWADATHEIVRSQGGGAFAKQVARPVNKNILPKIPVVLSPGWGEDDLVPVLDTSKNEEQVILFNVHGMADEPNWIGESIDREYLQIFSPERIRDFSKTILVTEACYGGALGYDTISITEDFFQRGGLAFLGSSTIAYGSNSANLGAADLMAKHFIEKVNEGATFGDALNHARKELDNDDPFIDEYSKKTILSFNLFGLPWMKRTVSKTSLGRLAGPVSSSSSVLANARASLANRSSQSQSSVLGRARAQYRSRLSEINRGFLDSTPEILEKLRTFRDYDKISASLDHWAGEGSFIQLQELEVAGKKGFRIIFKSSAEKRNTTQGVIVTNADGQIIKTLSSKG